MTDGFDKFEKWLTPLKEDGHRGIRKDAPEHIKEEAKKVNEEYYQRTGRYVLHIDY
ncbi:MAG: hypothetical protein U0L18_03600 [Acutalibacteraceae bacterium]|nr:hypothetical protein [Acutalibacteraceae bacterium]